MGNRKGRRTERQVINYLHENGWTVVRVPASGGGTDRDLPDVLVGGPGVTLAAEVKSSSGGHIYVHKEEIDALQRFGEEFGAHIGLIVKFDTEYGDPAYGEDRPGFYLLHPDNCPRTDAGSARVTKTYAQTEGTPVGHEELERLVVNNEFQRRGLDRSDP